MRAQTPILLAQARARVAALRRTADEGGTFHYTFFKALAVNDPEHPADRPATPE